MPYSVGEFAERTYRAAVEFTVRPAIADDAAGIEAVRSAGWRTAYRGLVDQEYLDAFYGDVEHRRERLAAGSATVEIVVVAPDGTVVGWCAGGPSRDTALADESDVAEVWACYVAPERWGSGIGAMALERVVGELISGGASRVVLWVLEGNDRARRFYEAHRFSWDGSRKATPFPGEPIEVRYERTVR